MVTMEISHWANAPLCYRCVFCIDMLENPWFTKDSETETELCDSDFETEPIAEEVFLPFSFYPVFYYFIEAKQTDEQVDTKKREKKNVHLSMCNPPLYCYLAPETLNNKSACLSPGVSDYRHLLT